MDDKTASLKLCYVEENFAWFTSHFEDEWGDDWDDVPYEHNAGRPYGYHYTKLKECVRHVVFKLAFEGSFDRPCDGALNSQYSVQAINAGLVPWLSVWPLSAGAFIHAGATVAQFIEFVEKNDGMIYLPREKS